MLKKLVIVKHFPFVKKSNSLRTAVRISGSDTLATNRGGICQNYSFKQSLSLKASTDLRYTRVKWSSEAA